MFKTASPLPRCLASRFITLLLVPCLVADPVTAAAFSNSFVSIGIPSPSIPQTVIEREALSPRLSQFRSIVLNRVPMVWVVRAALVSGALAFAMSRSPAPHLRHASIPLTLAALVAFATYSVYRQALREASVFEPLGLGSGLHFAKGRDNESGEAPLARLSAARVFQTLCEARNHAMTLGKLCDVLSPRGLETSSVLPHVTHLRKLGLITQQGVGYWNRKRVYTVPDHAAKIQGGLMAILNELPVIASAADRERIQPRIQGLLAQSAAQVLQQQDPRVIAGRIHRVIADWVVSVQRRPRIARRAYSRPNEILIENLRAEIGLPWNQRELLQLNSARSLLELETLLVSRVNRWLAKQRLKKRLTLPVLGYAQWSSGVPVSRQNWEPIQGSSGLRLTSNPAIIAQPNPKTGRYEIVHNGKSPAAAAMAKLPVLSTAANTRRGAELFGSEYLGQVLYSPITEFWPFLTFNETWLNEHSGDTKLVRQVHRWTWMIGAVGGWVTAAWLLPLPAWHSTSPLLFVMYSVAAFVLYISCSAIGTGVAHLGYNASRPVLHRIFHIDWPALTRKRKPITAPAPAAPSKNGTEPGAVVAPQPRMIIVGGTFDDRGGETSSLITELHAVLPGGTARVNGGTFGEIPELLDSLAAYDIILWFPNIPNDKEKYRDIKARYPQKLLITSKRNHRGRYSILDVAEHALKLKSNLVVEFSDDLPFRMRLIDPLGNVFEDTQSPATLAKTLTRKLQDLARIERQRTSRAEGTAPVPPPDEPVFFKAIKQTAGTLHELMQTRAQVEAGGAEYAHFRCERGFPSVKVGPVVYVSKRDFKDAEHYVSKDDLVAVDLDHFLATGGIEYYGPHRPAVDTPIQLRLYQAFPKIHYIMHSHEYVEGAPFTKKVYGAEALQEAEEIIELLGRNPQTSNVAVNLLGHGSVVLASDPDYLAHVRYAVRPRLEEHTVMNGILIGGRFDEQGGESSAFTEELKAALPAGVVVQNGGSITELTALLGRLQEYETILWFADVPKEHEALVEQLKSRYPYKVLITAAFNRDQQQPFQELIDQALGRHSNLLVEVYGKEPVRMRLLDPLSNQYADTDRPAVLTKKLLERLEALREFTRQGSELVGKRIVPPMNPEFQQYLEIIRGYGEQFHNLIHPAKGVHRFLGNTSFRASRVFPGAGYEGLMFVSRRNVDKRRLNPESFVAVDIGSYEQRKIAFHGTLKPSVDTPTQTRFYARLPNVNYILHAHVYIEGAPFTTKFIPCGSIEEVEEVLAAIDHDTTKTNFAVNLLGHGSIIFAQDLDYLKRTMPYRARPLPETLDTDGTPQADELATAHNATEAALVHSKYLDRVHVIGEGPQGPVALIVPNMQALESFAREHKLYYVRDVDLVNHPEIQRLLWESVENLNRTHGPSQRIQRIGVLRAPFTVESGELTRLGEKVPATIAERRQEIIGELARADDEQEHVVVEMSVLERQGRVREALRQTTFEPETSEYFESEAFAREIADLVFPEPETAEKMLGILRQEFKSGRSEHYSRLLGLKGAGEVLYRAMEDYFKSHEEIRIYRVMYKGRLAGRIVFNEKTKTLIDAIIFGPYRGQYLGDVVLENLKERYGSFSAIIPADVPIYHFFLRRGFRVLHSEPLGPVDLNLLSTGDIDGQHLQTVRTLQATILNTYAKALLDDVSKGAPEPEESNIYKNFPEAYDLLYQRFTQRLTDYLGLIHQHTPTGGSILDAAAGTGEASIPLLQAGYHVVSADLHRGMLEQLEHKAQRLGLSANTIVVDFLQLGNRKDRFDTITVRQAINYLMGEDVLRRGLSGFCKLLKPGGVLIFNAPNYDPNHFVPPVRGPSRVKLGTTNAMVWESNAMDAQHVLTHHQRALVWDDRNRSDVRYYRDVNTFQMYRKDQFDQALKVAGFSDIEYLSSHAKPYDPQDPVLYVIAKVGGMVKPPNIATGGESGSTPSSPAAAPAIPHSAVFLLGGLAGSAAWGWGSIPVLGAWVLAGIFYQEIKPLMDRLPVPLRPLLENLLAPVRPLAVTPLRRNRSMNRMPKNLRILARAA